MSPSAEFYVGPANEPDKYRMVHQVGSGGEAQLWKAELNVSGTWEPVAVKVLRADRLGDIDRWKLRWAEQAELLRFIRHPGVVGVREHFEGGPMHYAAEPQRGPSALYLVMNWVEGVPLRDWVPLHRSAEGHFESLRYLAQVGDVLDWLHSGQATPSRRPVIHADVTPANVIITGAGQAVLVDFGLTRLTAGTSSVVEGTRGYMAPEVLANGAYSPASDRYSFAALTYFVLTGQNPPVDRQALRDGFAAVPAIAGQPGLVDHLMLMFNPDPAERPLSGEWIRFFRASGTTTLGTPAVGLQPTVPMGTPLDETVAMAPLESQPRRRGIPSMAAIIVLALLLGAGIAYIATRGSGNKKAAAGSNSGVVSTTTTAPSTTVAPTTTEPSTTTSLSPSTTVDNSGTSSSGGFGSLTTTTMGAGSVNSPNGSPSSFQLLNNNAGVVDFSESVSPAEPGFTDIGPNAINGEQFAHAAWAVCEDSTAHCTLNDDPYLDLNLSRNYTLLTARVGVTDDSQAGQGATITITADGTVVFSKTFELGQSEDLKLNVTNVLRLRVDFKGTANLVHGAIGEPTVS